MEWSYHRYLAHTRITAEGEKTVRVESPEPIAHILDIFTEFYLCRITPDEKPILGTGRYRVTEFDKDKGRAVLEYANPRDGKDNSPQRIVATAEPSAEGRLRQLRQGTVDVALNLERVEGKLLFEKDLQWGKAVNTLSIYCLNCHEGIFASAEARLAVNHAVDTATLAREVFHDLAVPSATIVSPFHLGSKEASLEAIPFDAVKARRLLEGIDTSASIILRSPTYMPERAEVITNFVVASLEAVAHHPSKDTGRTGSPYLHPTMSYTIPRSDRPYRNIHKGSDPWGTNLQDILH